jgi:hypothetical protein
MSEDMKVLIKEALGIIASRPKEESSPTWR